MENTQRSKSQHIAQRRFFFVAIISIAAIVAITWKPALGGFNRNTKRPVLIRKNMHKPWFSFKTIIFLSIKMKAFYFALKCDDLSGQKKKKKN